jgi:hypothetical protein
MALSEAITRAGGSSKGHHARRGPTGRAAPGARPAARGGVLAGGEREVPARGAGVASKAAGSAGAAGGAAPAPAAPLIRAAGGDGRPSASTAAVKGAAATRGHCLLGAAVVPALAPPPRPRALPSAAPPATPAGGQPAAPEAPPAASVVATNPGDRAAVAAAAHQPQAAAAAASAGAGAGGLTADSREAAACKKSLEQADLLHRGAAGAGEPGSSPPAQLPRAACGAPEAPEPEVAPAAVEAAVEAPPSVAAAAGEAAEPAAPAATPVPAAASAAAAAAVSVPAPAAAAAGAVGGAAARAGPGDETAAPALAGAARAAGMPQQTPQQTAVVPRGASAEGGSPAGAGAGGDASSAPPPPDLVCPITGARQRRWSLAAASLRAWFRGRTPGVRGQPQGPLCSASPCQHQHRPPIPHPHPTKPPSISTGCPSHTPAPPNPPTPGEVFVDPVRACNGRCYERQAIEVGRMGPAVAAASGTACWSSRPPPPPPSPLPPAAPAPHAARTHQHCPPPMSAAAAPQVWLQLGNRAFPGGAGAIASRRLAPDDAVRARAGAWRAARG